MKKAGTWLFRMGWTILVLALLFFLLFGFTPLKQELYRPMLYSAMGELGYKVLSAEHNSSGTTLNIQLPEGQDTITEAQFREILAQAEARAQQRYRDMLQQTEIAAVSFAFLCFALSVGIGSLQQRRPQRKTLRREQRRKPQQAPAPEVLRENRLAQLQPIQLPTWEEVVGSVQESLLLVKDLSLKTELKEKFWRLLQEPRQRISKAEHLLWEVTQARERATRVREPDQSKGVLSFAPRVSSDGTVHDLRDLLAIEEFLPAGVDAALIKSVLVGFLQPGSQVPFFEGSYTSMEQLRRSTGLSQKELQEGLRYLKRIGLLHERRRKIQGRVLVSLATKANRSPAKEIAQLVLQARRSIEQGKALVR